MSQYMTKDFKIKNGRCEVCKQNELQSHFEELLKQFPKGAIFMLVNYEEKGAIYVLPEYEELAKQLFGDEFLQYMWRLEGEEAMGEYIDKSVIAGYIEYAYIDFGETELFYGAFDDKHRTCSRCKEAQDFGGIRAITIYYAFKSLGILMFDDPATEILNPRMRYGTVENFLKDKDPTRYIFDFEFDEKNNEGIVGRQKRNKVKESILAKEKRYYNMSPWARYSVYKVKRGKKHTLPTLCDADGSMDKAHRLIHRIYELLWGWNRSARSYFGHVQLGERGLFGNEFGADTINSVQTLYNSIAGSISFDKSRLLDEYIDLYHTIGNFVLVPARFNGWRGINRVIKDNFGRSLCCLQKGWNARFSYTNAKTKEQTIAEGSFAKERYIDYINYFFLWDYVDTNGEPLILTEEHDEVFMSISCKRMVRRGHFMVMMLRLRNKLNEQQYSDMMKVLKKPLIMQEMFIR